MQDMRTRTLAILLIFAAITGMSIYYFPKTSAGTESYYTEFSANATRAIDGDTIELEDGSKVRLLGINAPEKGQPKYSDAKAFLSSLVSNRTIIIQSDIVKEDRYGRLLGYVFVSNSTGDEVAGNSPGMIFVNRRLLEEGLAVNWFIEPNYRYEPELLEAERHAKERRLGLWNARKPCLAVAELEYDGEGTNNENLNGEYVVFENICDSPAGLARWKVKDDSNKAYEFSAITLQPGARLTLHTGPGTDNSTDLFWNSDRAIWNDDGDTLYLQDPDGGLALDFSYP